MPLRRPDIGFLPTPWPVVEVVFELAALRPQDVFYDLGSGDGRLLVLAAQRFGTRGVGIDIDPDRIQVAAQNAIAAQVSQLVSFRQQDLFTSDFQEATVLFLYLLPHLNLRLRPRLFQQLRPGTRLISLDFDMGDWLPACSRSVPLEIADETATLYYWEIPTHLPPNFIP